MAAEDEPPPPRLYSEEAFGQGERCCLTRLQLSPVTTQGAAYLRRCYGSVIFHRHDDTHLGRNSDTKEDIKQEGTCDGSAEKEALDLFRRRLRESSNRQVFSYVNEIVGVMAGGSVFVVTDLEAEVATTRRLVTCGYATEKTQIFFGSGPLPILAQVKFSLIRPSNRHAAEDSQASASGQLTSSPSLPTSSTQTAAAAAPSVRRIFREMTHQVRLGTASLFGESQLRQQQQEHPQPSTCSSRAGVRSTNPPEPPLPGASTVATVTMQPQAARGGVKPLIPPAPFTVVDLRSLLLSYFSKMPAARCVSSQILTIPLPPGLWSLRCKFADGTYSSEEGQQSSPYPCLPATIDESQKWPALQFLVTVPLGNPAAGFVDVCHTEVTAELDTIGYFDRILICPLQDTLPRVYEFNFFEGYILPFFRSNPFRLFHRGEIFHYHAVQFKLANADPATLADAAMPDRKEIFWRPHDAGPLLPRVRPIPRESVGDSDGVLLKTQDLKFFAEWGSAKATFCRMLSATRDGRLRRRVGGRTKIYQGTAVRTHWIDLLPLDTMDVVRQLPTREQPWAIMRAVGDLPQADLARILGYEDASSLQNEDAVQRAKWALEVCRAHAKRYVPHGGESEDCIVCLGVLEAREEVLALPCAHVFHSRCAEQWLSRNQSCPVCKRDVSSIRPSAA